MKNFLIKVRKIKNVHCTCVHQNSVFVISRYTNKITQSILNSDPCLWEARALPQSYNRYRSAEISFFSYSLQFSLSQWFL